MTCGEVSMDIVQPKSLCHILRSISESNVMQNMSVSESKGGATGHVFVPLSQKLESLSSTQSEWCIFKVHDHLRELNRKAYDPEILAIGPYHHGKERLLLMEEHKVRYLHILLHQKNENVKKYIEAMRQHEQKVRNFYAEPLSLSPDELVEMMVLDGCFIIELVRYCRMPWLRDPKDPLFKMSWNMNSLQRDIILFENQLPFFVLHELFGLIDGPDDERFSGLLWEFLKDLLPDPHHRRSSLECSLDGVKHLLDFLHINWLPPVAGGTTSEDNRKNSGHRSFIRCATELREAGVEFEKIEGNSFFDISFEKGTLKIPAFTIEDRTETFLRNLIAHEQYCESSSLTFVTEYVRFLDSLIDTSKDVEILCQCEIFDNLLGDGEVVSDIFNNITDSIIVQRNHSRYAGLMKRANDYSNKRRNRWMAKLRHDYFNSPWAWISFLAATFLIILTVIQTTFAVFPRN